LVTTEGNSAICQTLSPLLLGSRRLLPRLARRSPIVHQKRTGIASAIPVLFW